MKSGLLLVSTIMLLFTVPRPARAEITFICHAQGSDECAFSVIHSDGKGITNFVLGSNQRHGLNDNFAGGRYCVVVSKPRAQVKDWPPSCINAATGKPGKVGGPLKSGGTYD
jgi:hypothetical protein